MDRMVISIMCARYVLSAGSGASDSEVVLAVDGGQTCTTGVCGDVSALEGSGVPDSRSGTRSNNAVGKRRRAERVPGVLAKRVTESKRGVTRSRNSDEKF